jgi:hypothetical protein
VLNVPFAAEEYVKKLGKNPDEALVKANKGENDPLASMFDAMGGGKGEEGAEKPMGEVGETVIPSNSVEELLNRSL